MYFLILLFLLIVTEGLKLHGTKSSRSPLCNWYLIEKGIPFEQVSPRPSGHPFDQTPFLSDDGDVEIFESGAILLYLGDKYGGLNSPEERAKYSKWVVWANSELDNLCFGGMRGTSLDRPGIKALDNLDKILESAEYLVDNEFSVADVAVAAYLNYVPVFFGSADLSLRANICRYMSRNAARPAFAEAFGNDHAELVIEKCARWTSSNTGKVKKVRNPFGLF